MRSPLRRPLRAAVLLLLVPPLLGCDKLQGRQHFHSGNAYYEDAQYRKALGEYEEGLALDPEATAVWRSVGLAALALYRPGRDDAENQALGETAIEAFRRYTAAHPEDEKAREYLVTTLMNAQRFDEAVATLEEDARRHPQDRRYAQAVVRALTEAGKLQEAATRAARLGDPDVFYTIGVSAWAKSYYTPPASVDEHRALIELGLAALDRANSLRPDHFDTLSYLNLLWRERVKVEIDPFAQQRHLANAQRFFERALAIREAEQARERQPGRDTPKATGAPAAG